MVFDTLVSGGTVVTPVEIAELDVGIVDEQIAAIGTPGSLGRDAVQTIDATGCLVLPGGIDPHVHYSGPATPAGGAAPETQDYSAAAAFGGVTTIVDFAFQAGSQSLHDAIASKKEEAAGRMAVDFGLHAGFLGNPRFEVLDEIEDAVKGGLPTFKTFMIYPGWEMDDGHLWGVMNRVAACGGVTLVHAEDSALVSWLTAKYVREGKTHGAHIVETRPSVAEETAMRRALTLAERSGCRVYFMHVSSRRGLEAIVDARQRGVIVLAETTAPYLSFTAEKLWEENGLLWATTPPVKYADDRDALWRALASHILDVVSSDHFVVSTKDKYEKMGTTIKSLMGGYDGVELRVPLMFHCGVQEGRITLRRFVDVVSANPARIMGLYPRKGCLAPGADADIMIIDPEHLWTIRSDDLHTSADYCPWEGWELRGKVRTTLLRGSPLVVNENYVGSKTGGRFLPRFVDMPQATDDGIMRLRPAVRWSDPRAGSPG
jgi:dihydropyrimidinase